MDKIIEHIELSLPINTAYVSTARLTASSIANRLAFDSDELEDINAAVSEACAYIIRKSHGNGTVHFHLLFGIGEGFIDIQLNSKHNNHPPEDNEQMSLLIINALMDEMTLCTDSGKLSLHMRKTRHTLNL